MKVNTVQSEFFVVRVVFKFFYILSVVNRGTAGQSIIPQNKIGTMAEISTAGAEGSGNWGMIYLWVAPLHLYKLQHLHNIFYFCGFSIFLSFFIEQFLNKIYYSI
jgi:hypothetical protein